MDFKIFSLYYVPITIVGSIIMKNLAIIIFLFSSIVSASEQKNEGSNLVRSFRTISINNPQEEQESNNHKNEQPEVPEAFYAPSIENTDNPSRLNSRLARENEHARRKQFVISGLASIVRAAALIQISEAQYHNNFGAALEAVASAQMVYGFYLLLEPIYHSLNEKKIDSVNNDESSHASEMSSAKNYALNGVGSLLNGAEGFLFSFAAPDDPLAPFAILAGVQQFLVGAVSCAFPGYVMLKETFPFNRCCLPLNQNPTEEKALAVIKRKFEKTRLQQYVNTAAWHMVRGASTFYLAHDMPSKPYADMLRAFGSLELLYGLWALYDPFVGVYHYLNGTNYATHSIDEGSMRFYILRALGFVVLAPVNIVYTLGVPDAKTPWIVGLSGLCAVVGIVSVWNNIWDYYGFKCGKRSILPY